MRGREASNLFIPWTVSPGSSWMGGGSLLRLILDVWWDAIKIVTSIEVVINVCSSLKKETPSPTHLSQLLYFIAESEANLLMDHDRKAQLRQDIRGKSS